MTKVTKTFACLLFLVALSVINLQRPVAVSAQVSDSALASSTIVTPLDIVHVQLLSFGSFAAPTVSMGMGTIEVDPAGAGSTVSPNVTLIGTTGFGLFSVEGEPGYLYKMDTGSATSVTLTHSGGAGVGTMTANLVFFSIGKGAVAFPTALGNGGKIFATGFFAGKDELRYGGELTIGEGQAPGFYTGTFPVNLNY